MKLKFALLALASATLVACGGGDIEDDLDADGRAKATLVGEPGCRPSRPCSVYELEPDGYVTYFEAASDGSLGGVLLQSRDGPAEGWMMLTLLENGADDDRVVLKIEGPGLGTGYTYTVGANLTINVYNGLNQLIGVFDISEMFKDYMEGYVPVGPELPPLTPIGDLDAARFNYGTLILPTDKFVGGRATNTGRRAISMLYTTLQRTDLRRY